MDKDVIIILGGGLEPDGSLPKIPKLRVEKGVELFKEGVAPKIIVSGYQGFWLETTPIKSEAQAMKEYAMSLGIPEEAIIEEEDSKDTVGNAYFCRLNIIDPNNWKKIVVVTSEYHIPRTKYVFEKVMGADYEIEFVSVDSQLDPEALTARVVKEAKTMELVKEWFDPIASGDMDAIRNLMYTKHPGYSKNPEVSKEQLREALGR